MQPLLIAPDAHRRVEQLAQPRLGQQLLPRPVAHDASVAHEDDPLDLRQNVAQMMRHQHQPRSLAAPARAASRATPVAPPGRARSRARPAAIAAAGAPAPAQSECAASPRPTWCPPVARPAASLPCAPAPPAPARASLRSHADSATASMPKRIPRSPHPVRVVTAVRSPGNSLPIGPAPTTPKCLRSSVRSQRSRPKIRTRIPGRTMG